MSANHCVRFELLEVVHKFRSRTTRKQALEAIQTASQIRSVCLLENHPPDIRRMFHQFDIAIGVDFSVKWREKFHQVHLGQFVIRTRSAPGFLEGGSGGKVTSARGDSSDQYAHK